MHVLTLPRAWRRHDGDDAETWQPVAVPVREAVDDVGAGTATHRVVRRVDGVGLGSVAKLALLFYGFVFASLVGGVLLLWAAVSAMGYVHRFEHFMRSIGFLGFVVSSDGVVLGLIGIAAALTVLATLLTLLVACAYNIVGRVGHGLVLRMSEPLAPDAASTTLPTERPVIGDVVAEEANDGVPAEDGASHAA
jgi:hypothetical protein